MCQSSRISNTFPLCSRIAQRLTVRPGAYCPSSFTAGLNSLSIILQALLNVVSGFITAKWLSAVCSRPISQWREIGDEAAIFLSTGYRLLREAEDVVAFVQKARQEIEVRSPAPCKVVHWRYGPGLIRCQHRYRSPLTSDHDVPRIMG